MQTDFAALLRIVRELLEAMPAAKRAAAGDLEVDLLALEEKYSAGVYARLEKDHNLDA